MHTKRCLAQALISAIENARDREDWTAQDFQEFVGRCSDAEPYSENLLGWALGYLSDGLQDCRCWPERGAAASLSREEFYKAAEEMGAKGFTQEDAWNHLEGSCDQMYCGACNA